ncbi:hypothetical protein GYMLUDRAFT_42436 [Collybiopsis luxurians FD-317 M1]|uniref:F-box domain-containing protein n=1 Tax=Collybiopsis luxurians FD-317 M1 TaxID=944289 RepID=A0A0D0CHA7_9AGAR|nr:hypothetical protein GYMLUDRAFT_42436 [Collybiopsis luxurians FD-317 M1]
MSSVPPPLTWDAATSPFASVIGTNHVPSLKELAQLKAVLVEPQQELHHLESEITRIRTVLDGLLSQKKNVKTYIDAHQALMSPIRRIPSETLAEIFRWCLPSETAYGLRSLKHAPLLLTMVCRDWRRVARETPQLWTSLHIYFPSHLVQGAASQRIAGVNLWLQRSGMLPVSISLHGNPIHTPIVMEYPEAPGNMALMIKSLLVFRDRIQHMNLALKRTDLMMFLKLLASDSSFPHLTSVILDEPGHRSFHNPWGTPADEAPYYGTLLSQASMPMLQSLEIKIPRDGEEICLSMLPCHWSSLTNLSIKDFLTPVDLFRILTGSSALKSLDIGFMVSEASEQDHSFDESALFPTATLADLVVLHLRISVEAFCPPYVDRGQWQSQYVARISTITSCIICPSLRSLRVSMDVAKITFLQVPPFNLPWHELETLGLGIPMTSEVFTEFLSLVPNVTLLDFVDAGNFIGQQGTSTLADSHLLGLTPSPSNPLPLCPLLRRFRMIDHIVDWSRHWSIRALTDFITARRKARILDFCHILFATSPLFSDEEVLRLQQAREDGLGLHLHQAKMLDAFRVEDGPMAGLVEKYNFSPATLSDMVRKDGSFETDVII